MAKNGTILAGTNGREMVLEVSLLLLLFQSMAFS